MVVLQQLFTNLLTPLAFRKRAASYIRLKTQRSLIAVQYKHAWTAIEKGVGLLRKEHSQDGMRKNTELFLELPR